jgi:hypothetical protein
VRLLPLNPTSALWMPIGITNGPEQRAWPCFHTPRRGVSKAPDCCPCFYQTFTNMVTGAVLQRRKMQGLANGSQPNLHVCMHTVSALGYEILFQRVSLQKTLGRGRHAVYLHLSYPARSLSTHAHWLPVPTHRNGASASHTSRSSDIQAYACEFSRGVLG